MLTVESSAVELSYGKQIGDSRGKEATFQAKLGSDRVVDTEIDTSRGSKDFFAGFCFRK